MANNTQLFAEAGVAVLGTHKNTDGGPIASLTIGDNIKLLFPLLDISKGTQTDRIQVDVALDGTINVSGGINNGIGTYQMHFLDGPCIDTKKLFGEDKNSNLKGTAAEQYLNAKALKDRKIKVSIFSPPVTCGSRTTQSTNPIAVFHGIATSVKITLSTDSDIRTLVTQVDAIGSWETK